MIADDRKDPTELPGRATASRSVDQSRLSLVGMATTRNWGGVASGVAVSTPGCRQ
jgi:hypothetical protein